MDDVTGTNDSMVMGCYCDIGAVDMTSGAMKTISDPSLMPCETQKSLGHYHLRFQS